MNRRSVSLPRALQRSVVLVLATLTALAALAGVASAHVTVSSPDAAPGGFGKLVFRVPNESDTASTTSLRIQIPQEAAMASLSVQPVAGWTATLTESDLEEPLDNHGREISTYVSVVEFRAEDGGGIRPGEFQEFALSGGPFPDLEMVSFPTVQTYSDGSESAWIEPTVDGEEPEHPAPTLTLTTSGDPASATTETDTASSAEETDDGAPGSLALFLSILALLVGIAGVVLGWRAGRRTVSS
jgi:periplasmic copper chaperone A